MGPEWTWKCRLSLGVAMNSKRNIIVIALILAFLGITSCSREKENARGGDSNKSGIIAISPTICLSDADLEKYKSGPQTKDVLWRIAHHYAICLQNDQLAQPWLRKLADMNDPEAMVQLSTYLETAGQRKEAIAYAQRAADEGYRSGKSRLEELTRKRSENR
jgi:hypothetical protein